MVREAEQGSEDLPEKRAAMESRVRRDSLGKGVHRAPREPEGSWARPAHPVSLARTAIKDPQGNEEHRAKRGP